MDEQAHAILSGAVEFEEGWVTRPTELVLVRHGRPDIERDRPAATWQLADDAHSDVRLLAEVLPQSPVVIASDEPKAEQTARIIHGVVGGGLHVDGRLREGTRPDEWVADYEERGARYLTRGHEPGWEPADEVVARMTEVMNELPQGTIVVGHGLALTLYTATRATFDHVTFWRDLRLPDAWWTVNGGPPRRIERRPMHDGADLDADGGVPAGVGRRRTGRVVLVDDERRVLLFRVSHDDSHFWITPGGRAEPQETAREAACRELAEEVGLKLEPSQLGPPVARADGPFTWRGRDYWGEDEFFLVRAGGLRVDTSGFSDLEREVVTTYRWWSLDEIEHTPAVVYPAELALLVRGLVDEGLPAEPIELPWR